jgi:hypothetical protein
MESRPAQDDSHSSSSARTERPHEALEPITVGGALDDTPIVHADGAL